MKYSIVASNPLNRKVRNRLDEVFNLWVFDCKGDNDAYELAGDYSFK